MSHDLDQICSILDKLTLDTLTLMEKEIQLKLNLENAMSEGESHLAKSRFIMGTTNVSSLQIPENVEFEALSTINSEPKEEYYEKPEFDIVVKNANEESLSDPVRWFGYLVPQNLYLAQNVYKRSLKWVEQIANVQVQLSETCDKLELVRGVKESIFGKN